MTAARMRIGSLASEAWKARAAPRKPVWIDGGRLISRAAPLMASTASPREAPGARLNEIVTAGNCPWWAMTSGAARSCTLATVARGTCAEPPAVELVAQHGLLAQARQQPRRPDAQLFFVGVLEAVLELGAAHAVLDGEILHRLQVERDAGHVGQGRAQAVDHVGHAHALVEGLQRDEQSPAVERDVGAVHADERRQARHRRILEDHAPQRLLARGHGRKR